MLKHNITYSFWVEAKNDPEVMDQWIKALEDSRESIFDFTARLQVSLEAQEEMVKRLRSEMDARIEKPK